MLYAEKTMSETYLDRTWDELLKCFGRSDRARSLWRLLWTGGVSVQSNRIGNC